MKFSKIESKKLVFLILTISFVGLTTYGMIVGKEVPAMFGSLVSSVLGIYFGFGRGEKQAIEDMNKNRDKE